MAAPLDVDKVCRTCLRETAPLSCNAFDYLQDEDEFVCDIIASLCGVYVRRDDRMPHNVCSLCCARMRIAHSFRVQCRNSQVKLNDLMVDRVVNETPTMEEDNEPDVKMESIDDIEIVENKFDPSLIFSPFDMETTIPLGGVNVELLSDRLEPGVNEEVFSDRIEHGVNEEIFSDRSEHGVNEEVFSDRIEHGVNEEVFSDRIEHGVNEEVFSDRIEHSVNEELPANQIESGINEELFSDRIELNSDKRTLNEPPTVVSDSVIDNNTPILLSVLAKKDDEFQCADCFFTFSNYYDFEQHKLKHDHEEILRTKMALCGKTDIYICNECFEIYSSKTCFIKHIKLDHTKRTKKKKERHPCETCHTTFDTAHDLLVHIQTHRNDNYINSAHILEEHQYAFLFKSYLFESKSEEAVDTIFACKICGFSFNHKHQLLRHLSSHKRGSYLFCDRCTFTAKNKSRMLRHFNTHDCVQIYTCGKCDFKGPNMRTMRIHARTHRESKHEPSLIGSKKPIRTYSRAKIPRISIEKMPVLHPNTQEYLIKNSEHM